MHFYYLSSVEIFSSLFFYKMDSKSNLKIYKFLKKEIEKREEN
jgi:hypothetical protein